MSITLAAPIASFFAAIGSEAGKDAYIGLKEWLRRVAAVRRRATYGSVVVVDSEGTNVELCPKDLSDEAFAALFEIDWSRLRGCELVWFEDEKKWMDPHDYFIELSEKYGAFGEPDAD